MRARIAWALLGLTVLAVTLDTVFTAAHQSMWSEATWAEHGWPLTPMANLGCALMGALIVRRHPRHPIGWLLCVASLLSVTLAAEAYGNWVLEGGGPGPQEWGHVALWSGPLVGWPAFTALVLVFLIAPDGHLSSPRWRWAVWVTLTGLVLHTLGTLTTPPGDFVYGQRDSTRAITAPLLTAGWMLVAVGLIASAISLVARLRRSRGDERSQLLWIATAAALLAIGVAVILTVPRITGVEGTWVAALPLHVAQVAVPLCVAVAVLRHRLLEIDVLVSRAAMLALATLLVALGYVLVVVTVGLAVEGGTSTFWPSLLATAVVAVAFQPLRTRVVRIADRMAFGSAAAPYEALADFSRRIGNSPEPSALLPTVAEAAARAVHASRAVVVLHVDAGPDLTTAWPVASTDDPTATVLEVPVLHVGEELGSITLTTPAGRRPRPREHQLLADLAEQTGLAFRNALLSVELSGHVHQLGQRTRELSESRRRLISAGDAERSRLELAIAGQVLPHLRPLPHRLEQLSFADFEGGAAANEALLDPHISSLNTALDALREITRGVFPAQLARSGLPTALQSLLARSGTDRRMVVDGDDVERRFDPPVEAAAYFCVTEATRALRDPVLVVLTPLRHELRVAVTGRDGGQLAVAHIRDRVEACGGAVTVHAAPGHTTLVASFPAPAQAPSESPDPAQAVRKASGSSADLVM